MIRPVRWLASRGTRRLATAGLIALAAALLTGHAQLMLLAAPVLAALAATPRTGTSSTLETDVTVSLERCFEGEEVELSARVTAPADLEEIAFLLELPPEISLVQGTAHQVTTDAAGGTARWTVKPERWGRRTFGPVWVACRSYGGAWETRLALQAPPVDVFPHPPRARATLVPADLLRRIGEHTSRATGGGVEFAAVRSYLPGDRLRDVNWRVTSRRGDLHVNQRTAQRAADLVVMIDVFTEAGPAGSSTVDAAVHGAAGLVSAYLQTGDRAGVVALGGMLRWLGPAPGERHFYRIAELMLGVRYESEITPDLDRIPRTALPPGALVVLFTPLLDQRTLGVVADLRERGFPLVIVDILSTEPQPSPRTRAADLAVRIWRLDRAALRSGLAGSGIPVVQWTGGSDLDSALFPIRRLPEAAGRRG